MQYEVSFLSGCGCAIMEPVTLSFLVCEGGISIELVASEIGGAIIQFGAKKLLTAIFSDGSEKKLDLILSKLDQLQAAIARLSNEIKAAIAEGDLKEIEADMRSRLLACKEKTANGTMDIDDAQELLRTALHLNAVTTGTFID